MTIRPRWVPHVRAAAMLACLTAACTAPPAEPDDAHGSLTSFNSVRWSPDGSSLLVTSIRVAEDWSDYDVANWVLQLVDVDSGSARPLARGVLDSAFAPDGRHIAYGCDVDGNREILLRDLETGTEVNLTSHPAKDTAPCFSPDGTRIVFQSDRGGSWAIYVMDRRGGDVRRITDGEQGCHAPAWEPDGERIAYYVAQGNANDQIHLTDGSGSFDVDVTADDHHNIYPSWAPDGRLVFARHPDDVVLTTLDGAQREVLAGVRGSSPRFSPDGRWLAVIDERAQAIVLRDMERRTSRALLGPEMP